MNDLSTELLELIGEYCLSPKDKATLCLTSRFLYRSTVRHLYRHVLLSKPKQYLTFKETLKSNHEKRYLVRQLDLSSYTVRGSRLTDQQAKDIVVADDLAELIANCYCLKELLIGEEMMHAVSSYKVILSLFHRQNKLTTIDFMGFCDKNATATMEKFFQNSKGSLTKKLDALSLHMTEEEGDNDAISASNNRRSSRSISEDSSTDQYWLLPTRLEAISFYMCMALSQENFFIPFFNRIRAAEQCRQLRKLDLAYTQVTGQLFCHLQDVKSLTHLSIQGCYSLSCCSPFIDFVENNSETLIVLNISIDFNGIGGSEFCHACLHRIVKAVSKKIQTLDMGGRFNFSDTILLQSMATHNQQQPSSGLFRELKYLSLACCRNINFDSLKAVLANLPCLFYLNLARTSLTINLGFLPHVLEMIYSTNTNIKVVEISPFTPTRYPDQSLGKWKLTSHGRRAYYSRDGVDPRFIYSRKIILIEHQKLSPMNQYWSYSHA